MWHFLKKVRCILNQIYRIFPIFSYINAERFVFYHKHKYYASCQIFYTQTMICLQYFLAICLLITSTIAVEFQFLNRCNAQLWVGIQGNAGKSPLSNGGFAIKKGQRVSKNLIYLTKHLSKE